MQIGLLLLLISIVCPVQNTVTVICFHLSPLLSKGWGTCCFFRCAMCIVWHALIAQKKAEIWMDTTIYLESSDVIKMAMWEPSVICPSFYPPRSLLHRLYQAFTHFSHFCNLSYPARVKPLIWPALQGCMELLPSSLNLSNPCSHSSNADPWEMQQLSSLLTLCPSTLLWSLAGLKTSNSITFLIITNAFFIAQWLCLGAARTTHGIQGSTVMTHRA